MTRLEESDVSVTPEAPVRQRSRNRWGTWSCGLTLLLATAISAANLVAQGDPPARANTGAPVLTKRLDVGEVNAEQSTVVLKSVLSATRVGGTLAVADFEARKLVFYDSTGRVRRVLSENDKYGLDGFRTAMWIGRCAPGTAFVYDPLLSRITMLDAAGTAERSWRAPPASMRITCSTHGTFASMDLPYRSAPRSVWSLEPAWAPLHLLDVGGNFIFTIDSVDVGIARPAGRMTSVALSRDRLFVGVGDRCEVQVWDFSGRHMDNIRCSARPMRLTRTQYDSIITIQFGRRPGADSLLAVWREAPMPGELPPYRALHATPSGTLWLTLSSLAESQLRLEVLRGEGSGSQYVTVPVRGNVLEVGDDYIIVEYRTPAGAEHVAVFDVAWSGAARSRQSSSRP